MSRQISLWPICAVLGLLFFVWLCIPQASEARNINNYKDTLSTSAPGEASNHTFAFTLNTAIAPNAYFDVTFPAGFQLLSSSSFSSRNVELYVNGLARNASSTLTATTDLVTINPGSPGSVRYTLNNTAGIASGASLELKMGDHTSNSLNGGFNFSSSTGTSTIADDRSSIYNSNTLGTHEVEMKVFDGGEVADAGFLIAIVEQVSTGRVDTTETIPPFRFNGAPTSSVSGTTLNVEISLETNELAVCKYATTTDIAYGSMPETFSNTGLIFHSQIVPVTPESVQTFYVRCIDDEGNFNIDDYQITFTVGEVPTGTANTDGDTSGDGSGSGDSGTGDGSGGGGTTGESEGQEPLTGGSSGSGGSGGGGGGGSGNEDGVTAGGGFEDIDAPYESGDGEVVITGYSFPNSEVFILVDGKPADKTNSSSNGSYTITLEEIARGVYTFGIFGEDDEGVKSSTFSTSFTVSGARQSRLSNINVVPSIAVNPNPVDVGAVVTFSGYAIPNATVTIENQKDGSSVSLKEFTTTSAGNGAWSIQVPTTGFSQGTYKVRAKAEQVDGIGIKTSWSNHTFYGVGQDAQVTLNADLNRDGRVNLTDFSILLFWWGGDGGPSDPPADINQDGTVSLTDFSILLFNWTG